MVYLVVQLLPLLKNPKSHFYMLNFSQMVTRTFLVLLQPQFELTLTENLVHHKKKEVGFDLPSSCVSCACILVPMKFQHLTKADLELVSYTKLELEFAEAGKKLELAVASVDQHQHHGSEEELNAAKAEEKKTKNTYLQLARALGKKDASTQNKPMRVLLAEQVPAGISRSEGIKSYYVKWMQRSGREQLPGKGEERTKILRKLGTGPNTKYYPFPDDAISQYRDDVWNWLGVKIREDGKTECGVSLLTFTFEELTDTEGRLHKNDLNNFHQFTGGSLNKMLKHLSIACYRDDCNALFADCDAVELTGADWDHKILRMIVMGELNKGSKTKGNKWLAIANHVSKKSHKPDDFVKNFCFCELTCAACHTQVACMEY